MQVLVLQYLLRFRVNQVPNANGLVCRAARENGRLEIQVDFVSGNLIDCLEVEDIRAVAQKAAFQVDLLQVADFENEQRAVCQEAGEGPLSRVVQQRDNVRRDGIGQLRQGRHVLQSLESEDSDFASVAATDNLLDARLQRVRPGHFQVHSLLELAAAVQHAEEAIFGQDEYSPALHGH